jgi:hypothetical protein
MRDAKTATAKSAPLTRPSPSLVEHPVGTAPVAQASTSAPNYASASPASAASDLETHDVAPTSYHAASPDLGEAPPMPQVPMAVQGVTGSTSAADGTDAEPPTASASGDSAADAEPTLAPAKPASHGRHASLLSLPLTRAEARKRAEEPVSELAVSTETVPSVPVPKMAPRIASAAEIPASSQIVSPPAATVPTSIGMRRPAVPPLAAPTAVQTGTSPGEIHSQSADRPVDMRVMNDPPQLSPINVAARMPINPVNAGATLSNPVDAPVRRPAVPAV